MLFVLYLPFLAAGSCCGLAIFALTRDAHSFASRIFALGMLALAAEATLSGLSLHTAAYEDVVAWPRWRLLVTALVPGLWLLFSLSFARIHYEETLKKWCWGLVAAFVLPVGIVGLEGETLFTGVATQGMASRWVLGLGWTAYLCYLFTLVLAVGVLMHLEETLRASTGSLRWQSKFLLLGLGGVFAVRIYTASQALLYSSWSSGLDTINSGALLVAAVLIGVSFLRSSSFPSYLYLSGAALHRSLSVVLVGLYLLFVGILAEILHFFGDEQTLPLRTLILFLALLGLAAFLLSDEWRIRSKRFVNRHFQRPQYDYRREWARFTQRTASLLEQRALCNAVVKMLSETFGVACVSIWVVDENEGRLKFGGSTAFAEAEARTFALNGSAGEALIALMREQQWPIDFQDQKGDWAEEFCATHAEACREARLRYCAALSANQRLVGVLTLDKRLTGEPLSVEDRELLQLIADQTASSLLNIRLSRQLVQAKEIETFQSLSTFFIHDLKNLASTLSLTVQNLPMHFDNPEFRQDALRVIGGSVDKMNAICSRLSLVAKHLDLRQETVDLNVLIGAALAELNGSITATLKQDLQPIPPILLDPEQIQKVLFNLLLNAQEATAGRGEIRVATERRDAWAVMTVADNGPGMSQEFIEKSLFRPFQTTKSKGLGIGLFHSKKIIEAHHGRIEVESGEGKGCTFRVWLPVLEC